MTFVDVICDVIPVDYDYVERPLDESISNSGSVIYTDITEITFIDHKLIVGNTCKISFERD